MARRLFHLVVTLSFLVGLSTGNSTLSPENKPVTSARVVVTGADRVEPPLDSVGRQLGSKDSSSSNNNDDEGTRNISDSSTFILDNLVDQLVERVEAEVESRAPRRAPQLAADDSIADESVEGVPEEELHHHRHLQTMKLLEADAHIPYDTDQQQPHHPNLLHHLQYQQASKQPLGYLQEETNSTSSNEEANQAQQVAIVVMDLGGRNGSSLGPTNTETTNQTVSRNPYQARSMYQQQQQASQQPAPKAPQHTRPPYASHDQFAPTPSSAVAASNSSRTTQETSVAATLEQPPSLAGSNSGLAPTTTTVSNEPAASRANETTSSVFNNLNGRISSHLSAQSSRNSQLESTQLVERSGPSVENNKPVEGQLLQKLQPPNQMVDLNPIPAASTGSQQSADFYFPKEQLRHQPSVAIRGDRYPSVSLQDEDFMDSMASSSMHRYGGTVNGVGDVKGDMVPSQGLSQELFESDMADSSRNQPSYHQQATTIPRGPSAFAASLVNVTAPMVPPVSASEAMESALGVNQKVLLNQASGFIRNQGTTSEATVIKSGGAQQRHPAAANYYSSATSEVAAYSQPANQFSPKQSHLTNLDQTDSQLATMINATATMSQLEKDRMRLEPTMGLNHGGNQLLQGRRPQGPYMATAGVHNLTHTTHSASGFRSPPSHHHLYQHQLAGHSQQVQAGWPSSYLTSGGPIPVMTNSPPATPSSAPATISNQNSTAAFSPQQTQPPRVVGAATSAQPTPQLTTSTSSPLNLATSTTNGFITQGSPSSSSTLQDASSSSSSPPTLNGGPNRRQFNLTRVEHISAECSNDLIRTVIVFNGTFKGIIYSSGYVRDPNCMYINGTGKSRYDFSIRLNQCGTLGHQELRPPSGPNEVSRQDKVMWNTLSIQYNPIIEQEWDEHFRVSCEYGSDFWKTVSFSPFKVETNTGSPVMFTVDPPQCQMEILKGHGMVGPRQEAVSGPVTVGDPLTLLIHMKSEKAGYDILVKNCIAHNGGTQKMQLIDSNGCVVNERFISPFRGTYNDNDLKHVTLYSYLKAFRFTGSPVLYLECEIHMCQSKCPPQMCYWRRLSKRSTSASNDTGLLWPQAADDDDYSNDMDDEQQTFVGLDTTTTTYGPPASEFVQNSRRTGRQLELDQEESEGTTTTTSRPQQMSDKVSLFQALEVRQGPTGGRAARTFGEPDRRQAAQLAANDDDLDDRSLATDSSLVCYRRTRLLAYLIAGCSSLLVALSVGLGCCWRVLSQRRRLVNASHQHHLMVKTMGLSGSPLSSASGLLTSSSSSSMPPAVADEQLINYHKALASMAAPILQHPHSRHKDHRLLAY